MSQDLTTMGALQRSDGDGLAEPARATVEFVKVVSLTRDQVREHIQRLDSANLPKLKQPGWLRKIEPGSSGSQRTIRVLDASDGRMRVVARTPRLPTGYKKLPTHARDLELLVDLAEHPRGTVVRCSITRAPVAKNELIKIGASVTSTLIFASMYLPGKIWWWVVLGLGSLGTVMMVISALPFIYVSKQAQLDLAHLVLRELAPYELPDEEPPPFRLEAAKR